jgi:hypothetical protein
MPAYIRLGQIPGPAQAGDADARALTENPAIFLMQFGMVSGVLGGLVGGLGRKNVNIRRGLIR